MTNDLAEKRVGFIGLGIMGTPMATQLIDHGVSLGVFDVDVAAVETLAAKGAVPYTSPSELAANSNIVICMLPRPDVFLEVALGDDGLIHGMNPGGIVIDMATDGPEPVKTVGAALESKGIHLIDAPVGKGPRAAERGDLMILMGGDEEICQSLKWLLGMMGGKIYYCGPLGTGQVTKLANNLASNSYVAVLAEAYALASRGGARLDVLMDVMTQTDADSAPLRNTIIKKVLNHDFSPVFKVKLARKDVGLAVETAESLGNKVRCARGALEWLTEAVEAGHGELDQGAVLLLANPELQNP